MREEQTGRRAAARLLVKLQSRFGLLREAGSANGGWGMIRLAIIGAGTMGERIARAAAAAPELVTLTGVWDPAPLAMARIGAAVPELRPFADPEELALASECLYVACPPAVHLEYGRMALELGRALFCEKPLAVDVGEARAFVAAARGARAAVNFPFAGSPAASRLALWLEEGVIGTPQRLDITLGFAVWPRPWQRDAAGWVEGAAQGGFTREVGSHFLFLARRLCGPLELRRAHLVWAKPGEAEREVSAVLTAGGLPVTLEGAVGQTQADDENFWTLTGSEGALRLRDWSVAERLVEGVWEPDPNSLPYDELRPHVLRRQLEGAARMAHGSPHHLATLEEALEVQMVIEAILAQGRAEGMRAAGTRPPH
jgi:predicted dehydrogenase